MVLAFQCLLVFPRISIIRRLPGASRILMKSFRAVNPPGGTRRGGSHKPSRTGLFKQHASFRREPQFLHYFRGLSMPFERQDFLKRAVYAQCFQRCQWLGSGHCPATVWNHHGGGRDACIFPLLYCFSPRTESEGSCQVCSLSSS